MTISTKAPSRLLVLLALVVIALLLLATAVSAGGSPPEVRPYRVLPGDSLWSIAAGFAGPGDDVRRLVFDIEKQNELGDATIHPGQLLDIPLR